MPVIVKRKPKPTQKVTKNNNTTLSEQFQNPKANPT
jgi:hypothetical protein